MTFHLKLITTTFAIAFTLTACAATNSVSGSDVDANGVRDEIDMHIESLPDTVEQKSALRQISATLQNSMIVDATNQSALLGVSKLLGESATCVFARYNRSIAGKKSMEIEKLTVNTRERSAAYQKFNSALSGTTFVLPLGDGCVN